MNQEERDEKIRQEILLESRRMPVVGPGDVDVKVEDGVVTLAGRVVDASARQAAEQLARRVLGARAVANEIQIRRPEDDAQREAGLAIAEAFGRGRQGLD
jgi:osmotically-inducible protein OsmY